MVSIILFLCTLVVSAVSARSQQQHQPSNTAANMAADAAANAATRELYALFDSEWDYEMQQHPTHASSLGDRRWNDRWEDLSAAAIEARHQHSVEVLEKLKHADRAQLSAAAHLNYDLFRHSNKLRVEGPQYNSNLLPLIHTAA